MKYLLLTVVLFRFLASMNLPAAIEDSGGSKVPPSVLEKASEIKRQGGLNTLEKMINDLPESLTRNKEILDEVKFHYFSLFRNCIYYYVSCFIRPFVC